MLVKTNKFTIGNPYGWETADGRKATFVFSDASSGSTFHYIFRIKGTAHNFYMGYNNKGYPASGNTSTQLYNLTPRLCTTALKLGNYGTMVSYGVNGTSCTGIKVSISAESTWLDLEDAEKVVAWLNDWIKEKKQKL